MKKNYQAVIVCLFFLPSFVLADFKLTEKLMGKSDCLMCHKTNQRLVGPSFKEIADKYKGDLSAVEALVKAVKDGGSGNWGALPMPAHPNLSPEEIKDIVKGILSLQASGSVDSGSAPVKNVFKAEDKDIARGRDLFQGKVRFAGAGASCISCHHVKNDAIISGGILAKDLTSVFSRLGEPGVKAILGRPPFPVMERAYRDKALSEDEITALVSFLSYADEQRFYQKPKDYGMGLFISGVLGAVLLFLFFSLVGFRRKKKSVNQDMFDRQIKSE